ncbi:MAG: putative toxin-antitoxin system toxin component, PIN family [Deltaproteobacteria bacterium]|nr:putative toxin-antitoxin system toxin component, PIN family [Deltaproteobacteria bacterium]
MRVVFDTNIFISALAIPGSLAGKAVLKIIEGEDTLLISRALIDELLSTLAGKFSHDAEQLSRVAVNISESSEMVKTGRRLNVPEDDPDNRVLECAVAGKADLIITGDKKMLSLKRYDRIRIITLRDYLEGAAGGKGNITFRLS